MAGVRWIKAADAPRMSCDHNAVPCYIDAVVMGDARPGHQVHNVGTK
jgi:hypothetical protein